MVQLPPGLIEQLDRRAAREGVSRSQVVRDAVAAYLAASGDSGIAQAYEQGYSGIPFGTADEWGDLEAWHESLARAREQEAASASAT